MIRAFRLKMIAITRFWICIYNNCCCSNSLMLQGLSCSLGQVSISGLGHCQGLHILQGNELANMQGAMQDWDNGQMAICKALCMTGTFFIALCIAICRAGTMFMAIRKGLCRTGTMFRVVLIAISRAVFRARTGFRAICRALLEQRPRLDSFHSHGGSPGHVPIPMSVSMIVTVFRRGFVFQTSW